MRTLRRRVYGALAVRLRKKLVHVVVVHEAVKHCVALVAQLLERGVRGRTGAAGVVTARSLVDLLKPFELFGILLREVPELLEVLEGKLELRLPWLREVGRLDF